MRALAPKEEQKNDERGALMLDGRAAAAELKRRSAEEIAALRARHPVLPGLAVVRVGEDPASVSYAARIVQSFSAAGLQATIFDLPVTSSRSMLHSELHRLNSLAQYAGVLVQWPLPPHLDLEGVINVLDPQKDVDGTHPVNIGRLALGLDCYVPATPAGGIALLDHYGIKPAGMRVLVIGRSGIVGRPMSQILLARDATVTVAHSRTRDLASLVREADLVASAVGQPGLVRGDMLKPGAVVLDFGAAMLAGEMRGDVDFASVRAVASAITPVPGGTGPMTNVMLLRNTIKAITRSFADMGIA